MKTNAMSRISKILLFIIGLAAFLYGADGLARVRCGNQLISVGDPEFVVNQACGSPVSSHQVGGVGASGDELYAYYKVGNETIEIHFIDGHVYTIGGDENRN